MNGMNLHHLLNFPNIHQEQVRASAPPTSLLCALFLLYPNSSHRRSVHLTPRKVESWWAALNLLDPSVSESIAQYESMKGVKVASVSG